MPRRKVHGAIPPLPAYAFMAWYWVKKHRDNFVFAFAFKAVPVL
jgi:hypothetical protein